MNSALSPLTAEWFSERYGPPTPVQQAAWPVAASGRHLLAVAPTGSGKTLAAFLVGLDRLFNRPTEGPEELTILYISPLKALGSDVRENLGIPLKELKERYESAGRPVPDIRVGIRNGDTSTSERRRQVKRPPQILVTTPESLGILLLSDSGRGMLSTVQTCIVDEIHAIAPDRRGTLLSCHLERLADLAGEYQRIGLTATVRPIDRAAAFLGGYRKPETDGEPIPRRVEVIAPEAVKDIDICIESLPDPPEKDTPDPDAFWREIAERIRRDLPTRRSTLAFIDSRKWSEKMARLINEGEEETLAWAHHGSLSRDMRRLVETRLKNGDLKAVVATGSLELGIDVGPLDEVLLMGSPSSPSKALQRAGRAGHRPGETSRARIYPIHPPDLMAAAVLARMAREGRIEELHIPENPLDVLAQIIVSLCCERGRREEDLWNLVRRSWSFRNLPKQSFRQVISMLRGRYAETRLEALRPVLYLEADLLTARPGSRLRLYSGGGAIPDLGMYNVRQQGVDGKIGALDEKFVWESQAGMVFFLGNRNWRIVSITDRDVVVIPTGEAVNTEPFWRAEGGSRDPDFAGRVCDLLETAETCLSSVRPCSLAEVLADEYSLEETSAVQLASYLGDQRRRSGAPLPHRSHIVIEAASDRDAGGEQDSMSLFFHTFLGGKLNRPLALAIQSAWQEKSPVPIIPTVSDESIAFSVGEKDIEALVTLFRSLSNPEKLIRNVLESTPFFGGRFREAAGRALLLPASTPRRRQPLWMTRQRSRALMEAVSRYPDFPILAEVWRTCLNDEFAMDELESFLTRLRDGEVSVSVVRTPAPSPFAGSVLRRRLSRRMTANMRDEGDSRLVSRLEESEIRRLSRAGSLRPRIPKSLSVRLDRRRQRLDPGYAPGSPEALKAWIAEREAFTESDWEALLEAASAESGRPKRELEKAVATMVRTALIGPGGARWRISVQSAQEWEEAFEPLGKGSRTGGIADPETAASLAAFWLSGRGVRSLSEVLGDFGLEEGSPGAAAFTAALAELDTKVTLDHIIDGADETELCDSEGMEILLRWRRRQSRNTDRPLPASRLAGFLALRQNFGRKYEGEESVLETLELLEGYPLPAGAWEQSVLPARLPGYRRRDLDGLVRREELIWIGSGREKVAWLSARGGWRYPGPGDSEPGMPQGSETGGAGQQADPGAVFPRPGDPPIDFWSIADRLEGDSGDATVEIWAQVWSGRLSCPDMEILRKGIGSGFRPTRKETASGGTSGRGRGRLPGGIRGWSAGRPVSGYWFSPSYADKPDDPFTSDILLREQVRLLANRFGVLSRPLLEREIPPWRWSALSRTLGLMELGDELIGGRWFEELPMPQFMLPEALPAWRDGGIPGRPWCLEAVDPASPCGIYSDSRLPPRRRGSWIAWNGGGEAICILKPGSRSLEILPAGESSQPDLVGALQGIADIVTEREVDPVSRLRISTVNSDEEMIDDYRDVLDGAGFSDDGNGSWTRRSRPLGLR